MMQAGEAMLFDSNSSLPVDSPDIREVIDRARYIEVVEE
jgi:hypothetical protein